jgi:hypothetical protein
MKKIRKSVILTPFLALALGTFGYYKTGMPGAGSSVRLGCLGENIEVSLRRKSDPNDTELKRLSIESGQSVRISGTYINTNPGKNPKIESLYLEGNGLRKELISPVIDSGPVSASYVLLPTSDLQIGEYSIIMRASDGSGNKLTKRAFLKVK